VKSQLIAIVAAVLVVGCGPSVDIHQAAEEGNIEAVKQHLAAGTDVNAKNVFEQTPLNQAAWGRHTEIVELLITNGADVNAGGEFGRTPLLLAAIKGYKEIVELLIAEGADVNAKGEIGGALHYAAASGHTEVVGLLIANGADVNAKDAGDMTPLDAALTYEQAESADILRKHGGKTKKELKAAGN